MVTTLLAGRAKLAGSYKALAGVVFQTPVEEWQVSGG